MSEVNLPAVYSEAAEYAGITPSQWAQVKFTTKVANNKMSGTITAEYDRYRMTRTFDMQEDSWRDHGSPEKWLIHQFEQVQQDVIVKFRDKHWRIQHGSGLQTPRETDSRAPRLHG